MKGFALLAPGEVSLIDVPEPEGGPDQVVLRPRAVGICGSDVHAFRGLQPEMVYPCILGHEIAAEVVEVGSEVPVPLVPGDHVVVDPSQVCGTCHPCRRGRPNVCENLQVLGVHRHGGLAELLAVPYRSVHRVDRRLPFHLAAFAEPLSIAAQAVARGGVGREDTVAVIGAGPIGLAIVMLARAEGAHVAVVDLLKPRLELAESLGAERIIDAARGRVVEELRQWTDGVGVTVAVEAVGRQETLAAAADACCRGGRMVVVGLAPASAGIPALRVLKYELDVIGSRMANNRFPAVVQALEAGRVDPSAVITHQFPMDRVEEALNLALMPDPSVLKIVVTQSGL